jgi:hypothetical protein
LLSRAADALLRNNFSEAADLVRESDFSRLHEYCCITGKIDPLIHHRTKNPKYTPVPPGPGRRRMPLIGVIRDVLARDAYHCRFCGCSVIVMEARKAFIRTLPAATRSDDRGCHHFAFAALTASIDHVVPFRRGGSSDPDNLVTA